MARPTHYPCPSPQPHRQRVKSQLGIAMFNAGSLMNKLDELNYLASLSHIDVMGVTEAWPHDELKDHEVTFISTTTVPPVKEEEELPSTLNLTSDRSL